MSYKKVVNLRVINKMSGFSERFCSSGLGDLGSGAGKGGGGGGSIRTAGGSFGKREAALEEEYFQRLKKSQLQEIKSILQEEEKFHEEQIQRHKDALEKTRERINKSKDE